MNKSLPESIFSQDWWLNLTAGKNWEKISVDIKNGQLSFIICTRKRFKVFNEIYKPPLTPFSSLTYDGGTRNLSSSDVLEVLSKGIPKLVDKLPSFTRFKINLHPLVTWWSPFYWEGFKQTTRYTYRLLNIKDHDSIWGGFNSNIKRNVRKASKNLTVSFDNSPEELYELFEKTMLNQGRKPGYSKNLLIDISNEMYARNAGKMVFARDINGVAHSGLLLVWHNDEAYYLVGGSDPYLRKSGAMPFTMWEAIKLASNNASVFDFEGSMQKGIDKFIRNFGAKPFPYNQIYKNNFMLN